MYHFNTATKLCSMMYPGPLEQNISTKLDNGQGPMKQVDPGYTRKTLSVLVCAKVEMKPHKKKSRGV